MLTRILIQTEDDPHPPPPTSVKTSDLMLSEMISATTVWVILFLHLGDRERLPHPFLIRQSLRRDFTVLSDRISFAVITF